MFKSEAYRLANLAQERVIPVLKVTLPILLAITAVSILAHSRNPTPLQVEATIETNSISFRAAPGTTNNAGFFNSDAELAQVSVEGFRSVSANAGATLFEPSADDARLEVSATKLQSVDLSKELQVTLSILDRHLILSLVREAQADGPILALHTTRNTSMRCIKCSSSAQENSAGAENTTLFIHPKRRALRVRLLARRIPPEGTAIRLTENSGLSFRLNGRSQIQGGRVLAGDRKLTLEPNSWLSLREVRDGVISNIAVTSEELDDSHTALRNLLVTFAGTSAQIRYGKTEELAAAINPSRWRYAMALAIQKPFLNFCKLASGLLTLLGGILTLFKKISKKRGKHAH
jgi:hypothetical protein